MGCELVSFVFPWCKLHIPWGWRLKQKQKNKYLGIQLTQGILNFCSFLYAIPIGVAEPSLIIVDKTRRTEYGVVLGPKTRRKTMTLAELAHLS